MPPFFGLISFLVYMILYHPAPGSEGFITALMVFFAAVAWSATITLAREEKKWILYGYLSVSLIIPLIMPLFLKEFNILWHFVALGLILTAIIGLKLFIAAYYRYNKEN